MASIEEQIILVVERDPGIKVPEIAQKLGIEPRDLAHRLPHIIEQQGWDLLR
jgi:hypothetical protein